MTEEFFDKKSADELTLRIADRLGERQRKLESMAKWEQPARKVSFRPAILSVMSIAACVAIAFILFTPSRSTVNPIDDLGLETPMFEEYRAAMPRMIEISQLLTEQRYADALPIVEEELATSDMDLQELMEKAACDADEELAYETETEQALNGELRWAYIYILVRENKFEEACKQLQQYLEMSPDIVSHREEAENLLKKIKKVSN